MSAGPGDGPVATAPPAPFATGSLVRARGREWVVLPGSEPDLLLLRPLGGTDDEVTGIYLPVEPVTPATFAPPGVEDLGDFRTARLLRDALRLGFRDGTAPLRCLAHIAVDPRPYQLVPLLMALRQHPVRLLVADDVGVGKTVEAALVARELLDRGEVTRLAVLCPPHLAEQWQRELADKFHLDAVAVLAGTAARLERGLGLDESLFDRHPYVVVSTDFIKSDRRRHEFLRTCPELVIVDEAHTCADQSGGRGRHQRHDLVRRIAADPDRHLILVTATPHSGNTEAFGNLLGFLHPDLTSFAGDMRGSERRQDRERLARHFVQRRRGDLVHYLQADTPFPTRKSREVTYTLSAEYKAFFGRVLRWCRETVQDPSGSRQRQRVRWWAALALLRAVGSSPAAAAATLRERARAAGALDADEADALGRRSVLDLTDDEDLEGDDVVPGADPGDDDGDDHGDDGGEARGARRSRRDGRRLPELARAADALAGPPDRKLTVALDELRRLLDGGCNPVVFCRFIDTALYVAEAARRELPDAVAVDAVTGRIPAAEREDRVATLAEHPRRVLVATDCLSEGINLQDHFDAVVHYDLSWNPTRHEQREGRVDRFGQPRPVVHALTCYGTDNPIDGIVLDVLLRKHQEIRRSTGVAVPVPGDSDAVLEAILEGLLLRGRPDEAIEGQLELFERDVVAPQRRRLHEAWDEAADREHRSRSIFAQHGVKADEVAAELEAARRTLGGEAEVVAFVHGALTAAGAAVTRTGDRIDALLTGTPDALRDALGVGDRLVARIGPPGAEPTGHPAGDPAGASAGDSAGGSAGAPVTLTRTHPVVERLAAWVLDTALDPAGLPAGTEPVARRAGVVRTRSVDRRTTLLLVRFRFDLAIMRRGTPARHLLAEEAGLLAFTGAPHQAAWLPGAEAEALLAATPDANVAPEPARDHLQRILDGLDHLHPALDAAAAARAGELEAAHNRVRAGAGERAGRVAVHPQRPVDLLGVYVYLPEA